MAASNRSSLLTKTHKVLKKEFKPFAPDAQRPLLEQLVFAACLEDSHPEAAEQAYQALVAEYFDWNEVRVSTVTELSESIKMLAEPAAAAGRVKQLLHSVFESIYGWDLEGLKKLNIGVAEKKLEKHDGVSPFVVAYIKQNALGGHAIPVGAGALDVMFVIGAINEKERAAGTVPGLERAIPKNKGVEFGSLLHQLGVEYARSPFSPNTRKLILEIEPEAKERLPKRQSKKREDEAAAEQPKGKSAGKVKKKQPAKTTRSKTASKAAAATNSQPAAKKPVAKKTAATVKKTKPSRTVKTKQVKKKPR